MRQVAHALKSLKTQHKGYPLAALQSQAQIRCTRNKETTVELEARDTQHTRFTHKTTPPDKASDKMTGMVCQILAARRAPCQIVNVRLEFDTCVKFSARPGPSDVKFSAVLGPLLCQSVKFSAVLGPPCVKFPKKRSSLLSIFLDGRCMSKSQPAVGTPCVKFSKKTSPPCV